MDGPDRRRRYRILDAVVEIACDDGHFADVMAYVLGDVPASDATPDAVLELQRLEDGRFAIAGPTAWAGEVPEDETVPRLVTILNGFALSSVKDELCVHGAGAVIDGSAHALIASSGVGKTTLLTALMRHGAAALNDELLRLSPDGLSVRGWPKPLSIKPGTGELFPDLESLAHDGGKPFRHVPLSAVGSLWLDSAPVTSVLLLRRGGNGAPRFETITPTAAVVALVSNTMNFFSFGAVPSLTTLVSLVASRPCAYFDLDAPDASARMILEQASKWEPRSLDWELIDATTPYMVDGVLTLRIEDEAVLWSPESLQAIALDPAGTALWIDACEGSSDRLVEFVAFARSLVDQGMLDLDRTLETKRLASDSP